MKNLKLKSAIMAMCIGLGVNANAFATNSYGSCTEAAYFCEVEHDFNACLWQFKNCNV